MTPSPNAMARARFSGVSGQLSVFRGVSPLHAHEPLLDEAAHHGAALPESALMPKPGRFFRLPIRSSLSAGRSGGVEVGALRYDQQPVVPRAAAELGVAVRLPPRELRPEPG
jgi:hypothetical protein